MFLPLHFISGKFTLMFKLTENRDLLNVNLLYYAFVRRRQHNMWVYSVLLNTHNYDIILSIHILIKYTVLYYYTYKMNPLKVNNKFLIVIFIFIFENLFCYTI